jgi:YVTN family beta-propeller protein
MRSISLIAIVLVLVSCKKDPIDPIAEPATKLENGVLVMCEGLFQQNNSTISWIDRASGEVNNQFFQSRTNRQIGDTGNDMQRYGGKIYIVVNVSSSIEVLDAIDFTSIKRIPMMQGNTPKQPRSICFNGDKAYVSCYDGYVDVIDTATLSVLERIQVGENPEGVTIANGKLYVANSGGLNFPNVDSTVSVIDLTSNSELTRITVGPNPGGIITDDQGDVYVIARGDYGAIPSRLKRIDSSSDALVEEFQFDINGIVPFWSNRMLVYTANGVSEFSPTTEQLVATNFIDVSNVTTLYNVAYGPDDKIYVLDAMNYTNSGFVRVYNSSGTYESSYNVGLNPSKVLFYD